MNVARPDPIPRRRLGFLLLAFLVLAGAGTGWLLARPRPAAPGLVRVERGDLTELLHEAGEIAPRDGIPVAVPFDGGRLQWIADDLAWIEAGETLFVLSADEELRKAAEARGELVEARQELQLARMRCENGRRAEARRLVEARRNAELEGIRFRIATAPAEGGLALVRLDRELAPLEPATARAREAWELAQAAWQERQEAWLAAWGVWQDRRDELARLGSLAKDLEVELEEVRSVGATAAVPTPSPAGRGGRGGRRASASQAQVARQQRPAGVIEAELARTRAEAVPLRAAIDRAGAELAGARELREAAAAPLAAAEAALTACEDRERELRIRIEIEKRALRASELELELKAATIACADAVRRAVQAEAAFATGALSRRDRDDAQGRREDAEALVRSLEERLAEARAPIKPEKLAEAQAALDKALRAAERAQEVHDRAVALLDRQIDLQQARVRRLEAQQEARLARFPEVIEADLAALEGELAEAADGPARQVLQAGIERLRQELERTRASPPNQVKAPVSGLVRHRRNEWGSVRQVGDTVWQGDVVVDLYPKANLEVLLHVNEVAVARLSASQAVAVEVPAIGVRRRGSILAVGGVGRDKAQVENRWAPATGVTQFEVHVGLEPAQDPSGADEHLRQGMSVLASIEVARAVGVLHLPRAAVDAAGTVLGADGRTRQVRGRPFGTDRFIIEAGLCEGEAVVMPGGGAPWP